MLVHHHSCMFEQMWDISDPAMHCTCGPFYPRRECTKCWRVVKLCRCKWWVTSCVLSTGASPPGTTSGT